MSRSAPIQEVPQQRYANGIRAGSLEPIYFDMGIMDLLRAAPEHVPPEWRYPWTAVECGQKWSVRVLWPGYDAQVRQINVKDHSRNPQPVSKYKLGQHAAKALQSIIEELSVTQGTDAGWRVGPNAIRLEDVVLMGLHNVSQGSWQASLGIKMRR